MNPKLFLSLLGGSLLGGESLPSFRPPSISPKQEPRAARMKRMKQHMAPVCDSCRRTLSRGDCLNRMCDKFVGGR
jgi:hypothetical protein